jgi:hypothetical protein
MFLATYEVNLFLHTFLSSFFSLVFAPSGPQLLHELQEDADVWRAEGLGSQEGGATSEETER